MEWSSQLFLLLKIFSINLIKHMNLLLHANVFTNSNHPSIANFSISSARTKEARPQKGSICLDQGTGPLAAQAGRPTPAAAFPAHPGIRRQSRPCVAKDAGEIQKGRRRASREGYFWNVSILWGCINQPEILRTLVPANWGNAKPY